MNLMKSLVRRFKHLRRDEGGSGTVEMLFMVPLLIWCLLATVTYFHAYRSEHTATKAASTLADMVSRETEYITPAYLDGMRGMLQFLTMSDTTPQYRLTVFTWDAANSKYVVRWSRRRGSQPTLKTSDLVSMTGQLPLLKDGERAIIVETWTAYHPRFNFNLGLSDFDFENFVVVTPRFAGQLCFAASENSDPEDASC